MARSKKRSKKTVSQNIVGVATVGLPSPAKKFLGGRMMALLIVVLVPVLLATGIVSVSWENGRPRVSFNRERAAEAKQAVAEEVQSLSADHRGRANGAPFLGKNR